MKPLSEETRLKMIRNEFGGINEAMYNLYSITRDEKHLQVARFFYHNDKIDPLKAGNNDLGIYFKSLSPSPSPKGEGSKCPYVNL